MGYKAYLIEQYDTTHENIFFKEFSEKLAEKFRDDISINILIGNLSINGNQIDALFIRNKQITVIDFKNYGGKLKFSENNPWSIVKNEKIILVTGGAYNRNPFQQVNQYRRTLIDFLGKYGQEIVKGIREDINWGHISSVVLFHQPIEFNKEDIPERLVYFHITDFKNSIDLIFHIRSNKLNLSELEIENLLKELNINDSNLFDKSQIVENSNDYEGKIKFDLLKRLVKNTSAKKDEIKRVLDYYRIILDIESYREETKIENAVDISIDSAASNIDFTIDFTQDNRLYNEFSNNKTLTFPKDVFIGIKFSILDINIDKIFLYQIVLANEIDYTGGEKTINADNFDIYTPSFRELNFPDELIDELGSKIKSQTTLLAKIDTLKNELSTLNIREKDKFTIAFTSKNLTNSQLSSELNKLTKTNISDLESGLINNFLLSKPIINSQDKSIETINTTLLNSSQEEALNAVFENTLTVITGPPGTGKTQLVLNIISNAIVNDQKILFASKNNKAVDNVIERFISKYLLRIGSNAINENQLIPRLNEFIDSDYSIDTSILTQKKAIKVIKDRVKELDVLFLKQLKYPIEIEEHRTIINTLKERLLDYPNTINPNEKRLFFESSFIFDLDQNEINFILQKLSNKNSTIFARIFFKLFQKTNLLKSIINIEQHSKRDIINYVNSIAPLFIEGKSKLKLIIDHLLELLKLHNNYLLHIKFKEEIEKHIQTQSELVKSKQTELNWIIGNLEILNKEHKDKSEEYVKNSQVFLMSYINNKLSKADSPSIANFKSYINSAPWKDDEYRDYVNACKQFIENFNAVSVTNLSVKKAFSLSKEMFDILVIDEASQCDIASAIPLIFRAKKVVIIGDPNQLKHITSVKKQYEENYILNHLNLSEKKFNYEKTSLFDFAKNLADFSNIKTQFLKEHYRCHPKIIQFSNSYFYRNELVVKTKETDSDIGIKGIVWINTNGVTATDGNFNLAEKEAVIKLSQILIKDYPEVEMGITTPFKDQQMAIERDKNKIIDSLGKVEIKTIHKFQGDEKDIIILSLVVTKEAKSSLTDFINVWAKYLLNVAVTRAKSTLYIVGDFEFCKNDARNKNRMLSKLAEYVEFEGHIVNL